MIPTNSARGNPASPDPSFATGKGEASEKHREGGRFGPRPDDALEPNSPPPGCPDSEEIGALIEGTFTGENRLRIEAHLLSCADCFEAYADAIRLLAEEEALQGADFEAAAVTPFRRPNEDQTPKQKDRDGTPPRRLYTLGWAAAVAVVALGGWLFSSLNRMPSQSSLISRFEGSGTLEGSLWAPDVPRGGEIEPSAGDSEESLRLAFQAGASAFDLEVSARRGDFGLTARYADELARILETRIYAEDLQNRLLDLSRDLENPTFQREAARAKAIALAREVEELDLGPWTFAFGRVIEAAHLAASLGDASFFSTRSYRKTLDLWMKKQPRAAAQLAAEEVRALRTAWDARPLDLREVGRRLGDVQSAFGLRRADPKPIDSP